MQVDPTTLSQKPCQAHLAEVGPLLICLRNTDKSLLIQTIFFAPKGLLGLIYWSFFYRVRAAVFSGLIKEVARRAELLQRTDGRNGGEFAVSRDESLET